MASGASGTDPSMDDILVSIRRMMNETGATEADDVLTLDESMMVAEPTIVEPTVLEPAIAEPTIVEPTILEPTIVEASMTEPTVTPPAKAASTKPAPEPVAAAAAPDEGLVAPAAAFAAVSAITPLLQRIAAERSTPVFGGGPTLEDLVRDVMRPLLKDWLDAHLPVIVERLVRVEIERVVGKAAL